ncbi:MAG: LacI family DNA-binding transcriptional regulator [Verrucomicrobiota bacterium]
MKTRVTLKTLAEATGFHVTTVSGVLRGKPHFNPETVKAIQEAAKRLGYVPDPMLSALAAYRSGMLQPVAGNTLACIGLGPKAVLADWGFDLVMPGILRSAKQQGFTVDFFNANEKGMNWKRLGDILYSRGIKGVIFPAGPNPDMVIPEEFPFGRFSVVAIEDCIVQPASLHRVMNHRSRNVILAVEHCIASGYRRIGMATFADREQRQHRAETGSLFGALTHFGVAVDIPVFAPKKLERKELLAWYKRYQPDAILCSHHDLADCLMAEPSVGAPQKTAVVHYHIVDEQEPYAGVRTQHRYIGVKAVDMVVAMINRGEVGLPESSVYMQVPGVWHPGRTLIKKGSK